MSKAIDNKLYIEKARYDALMRAFLCSKRENADRRKAMEQLKNAVRDIDDLLIDLNDDPEHAAEMRAYILGVTEAKLFIAKVMKKIEEETYVSPCK